MVLLRRVMMSVCHVRMAFSLPVFADSAIIASNSGAVAL